MDLYMLDAAGNPVRVPDTLTWGLWYETADRQVARTEVGVATVSTVFLGLDHRSGPRDPDLPILWETMVFDGALDGEQERYTSRAAALAGHAAMVERVRLAE